MQSMMREIITVSGPVDAGTMGLTLPHEHILVDFIGAEKAGGHRYKRQDVIDTMLPQLKAVRAQGVRTFIDATPMFLGRDVVVLEELSRLTGLNIVTNTGQYKEPFLPRETFEEQPEKIAEAWIEECHAGIDGTGIKPGFIKTAVTPGSLGPVAVKVIRAAAVTSKRTGLAIATHCGCAVAALEILDILETHGVSSARWIFVHAQNEEDMEKMRAVARRGAWIEFDGVGKGSEEKHAIPLLAMLESGYENQLLLSQDAGWYRVGEEPGGAKKAFTFLVDDFLPLMKAKGVTTQTLDMITVDNPASAFCVKSE